MKNSFMHLVIRQPFEHIEFMSYDMHTDLDLTNETLNIMTCKDYNRKPGSGIDHEQKDHQSSSH